MHLLELLFVVALILYSFVIWSHKLTGRLPLWMVWLFGVGLTADIGGTIFLCVAVADRWKCNLHTVFGLVSLLIMAIHFVWALLANSKEGDWKIYFDRFSVYAWCLWMVAFVSGMPL